MRKTDGFAFSPRNAGLGNVPRVGRQTCSELCPRCQADEEAYNFARSLSIADRMYFGRGPSSRDNFN